MTADSIPQTAPPVPAPVAPDIPATVARLRATFATGRTRPVEWRKQQLKALAAMMDWLCLMWFALGEEPYPDATRELDHVADSLARLWYRVIYAADPSDHDRLASSLDS